MHYRTAFSALLLAGSLAANAQAPTTTTTTPETPAVQAKSDAAPLTQVSTLPYDVCISRTRF